MGKNHRSRVAGAASRPVTCEMLEPRLMMSGNVAVTVHDGWLEVRGDRFANQITIDQTGLSGGQFRVSPADADTTINGQSQAIVFDGVGNLRVRLGGGNDKLTLQDVTLDSSWSQVRLNMGSGNDTLAFVNDTFSCRMFGNMGRGKDVVLLDQATTFDTRGLWIKTLSARSSLPNVIVGPGQPHIQVGYPTYRIYGGRGRDLLAADEATLASYGKFFHGFSAASPAAPDPDPISDPITIPIDLPTGWDLGGRDFVPGRPVKLPSGHIVVGPTWTIQQQLSAANTDFAFDLYHQLQAQQGNIFFSPLSISAAMAMLYAGAGGETAGQIAQTMSFLLPQGDFASAFGTLLNSLTASSGENSTLDIANSLWGQKGFAFLNSYLQTLQSDFQSEMHKVDFQSNPEAQRAAINKWVSDHTDQMIQDLLPKGSIDGFTRLVLANAIYFNAQWEYSFDQTVQQAFHLAGGDVNVSMMKESEDLKYFDGGNFQAVEIPYVGDKSMIVLLPVAGQFDKFDSSLTAAEVQAIENGMSSREVNLSLPKFGYEQSTSLRQTLSDMGITDAFTPNDPRNPDPHAADLSGIDGKVDLYVSGVIHKAKIEVSEKGTKAAAATAIVFGASCTVYEPPPPPPINVTADHPFIYLIRDNATNSTLFVGRVSDATAFS